MEEAGTGIAAGTSVTIVGSNSWNELIAYSHLMWRPVTGKLTGTGENKYVLPWKESPTAKERKPLPQWAILRYAQLNNENVPDHKLKRRASLQCAQLNNESVPDHKLKRSASLLLQDALIRYAKLNNRSDSEEYEEI